MAPANAPHSSAVTPSAPTLPGQPCSIPPRPTWQPSEQWVWQQVCTGQIADFNFREGQTLDPSSRTGWDDTRSVSATFLETVLLCEPYRSALPRLGVCIVGAWVEESLDLEYAHIGHQLRIEGTRFEREVRLQCLKSTETLSFGESYFAGALILEMAEIQGALILTRIRSYDSLKMLGLQVGTNLVMDSTEFPDIDLDYARIKGGVTLADACCPGKLKMNMLQVGTDLQMHRKARFGEVLLTAARIEGALLLWGAHCSCTLSLDSLRVGNSISMEDAVVDRNTQLIFARIGENLRLQRAQMASLDLTGASIQGVLDLGGLAKDIPQWKKDAQLVLRNTTVGAIHCPTDLKAWPVLELDGLSYKQLGGLPSTGSTAEMAERPAKWFNQWLEKDHSYSRQPSQHLASVLQGMGYTETANTVLYTNKERERHAAPRWTKRWGMNMLRLTIGYGYGYRYFYSLWWVAGLTLLGAAILATASPDQAVSLLGKLAHSFDLLLPIVDLNKSHSLDGIDGWQQYYFYFHELAGYVLGAFIAAGLAGITKK